MTNTDVKEHPDLEEMESSLNELGDYLFQTKDRHRKLRWWSQGITAAIVIAIAVYMVLFYQTLSSNLTSELWS